MSPVPLFPTSNFFGDEIATETSQQAFSKLQAVSKLRHLQQMLESYCTCKTDEIR
jgi:hypothetical protein